jgi:hypothetical protein
VVETAVAMAVVTVVAMAGAFPAVVLPAANFPAAVAVHSRYLPNQHTVERTV